MIIIEYHSTRVRLNRTFSDLDHYIVRDGFLFEEAVEPEGIGRVYTESDKKIIRRPAPTDTTPGMILL